jgi:hypothetical protein
MPFFDTQLKNSSPILVRICQDFEDGALIMTNAKINEHAVLGYFSDF